MKAFPMEGRLLREDIGAEEQERSKSGKIRRRGRTRKTIQKLIKEKVRNKSLKWTDTEVENRPRATHMGLQAESPPCLHASSQTGDRMRGSHTFHRWAG